MQTFRITLARTAETKHWPKAIEVTFDKLSGLLTTRHHREDKDGFCFIPAALVGDRRASAAVTHVSMLTYDVDGGQPLDEIIANLEEAGFPAFVYSSFNHLTCTSRVNTNHYDNWAKRKNAAFPPTRESLLAYLSDNRKGYLADKSVEFDAANADKHFEHTNDGRFYVLHHDPLEKYRVGIPLKSEIDLNKIGGSTQRIEANFKTIYNGVGRKLKLKYDTSCEDPSRLYYLPSSPPGRPCVEIVVNPSNTEALLDWTPYACAAEPAEKASGSEPPKPTNAKRQKNSSLRLVTDAAGRTINLIAWHERNRQFDIEALLVPVRLAGRGAGGYHIGCPYECEHSTAGGNGTFCTNDNQQGNGEWTIFCSHNACHSRGKLDLLAGLIEQGTIKIPDLKGQSNDPVQTARTAIEQLDAKSTASDIDRAFDLIIDANCDALVEKELLELICQKKRENKQRCDREVKPAYKAHKKRHASATKAQPKMRNADELPLGAVVQLKTMLIRHRVQGDVVERGEGFKFEFDGVELIARDADLFGHTNVLERDGVKWDEGISVVLNRFCADAEVLKLQPVSRFAELFPNSEHVAKVQDEHSALNDVRKLPPQHLETPNIEALETVPEARELMDIFKLNLQYSMVEVAGSDPRIHDRKTGKRSSAAAFTLKESRKKDFVTSDGKLKVIRLADEWLESIYRPQYDGVGFYPEGQTVKGTDYRDNPATARHFNLWAGFAVKPRKGSWELLKRHLRDIVCNGNLATFDYVLKWMAWLVQNPGLKPRVALVTWGAKQIGKSITTEFFADLWGEHGTIIDKADHAVGRFANLSATRIAALEEAIFSGNHEHENATKHMVTSQRQRVENKHEHAYDTESCTAYWFNSNSPRVVKATADEERFVVLKVSDARKGDKRYFEDIINEMNNGGREAMLYELLFDVELGDFTPWSNFVQTSDFKSMMLDTLEGGDRALMLALTTGRIGGHVWSPEAPLSIKCTDVYDAFEKYMPRYDTKRGDQLAVANYLRDSGIVLKHVEGNRERQPRYVLSSLSRARTVMADKWNVDVKLLEPDTVSASDPVEAARALLFQAVETAGLDPLTANGYQELWYALASGNPVTAANDDGECFADAG